MDKNLKPMVNDCNSCFHPNGEKSLNLSFDDVSINFSTHSYDHKSGNSNSIWISGLNPDQWLELAEKIKIVVENLKNKEDI